MRSLVYSTREIRGIDELHRFDEPVGTMVDPRETIRFIEWLPSIEWFEAYVALLLVRTKGLKERFGFKGSDHCLQIRVVPGYHRNPKLRLFLELRRMAVLARYAPELFIYERHVSQSEIEVYRIPSELVDIMVSPNPSNWVKASVDTVEEFTRSLHEAVLSPSRAQEIVRRIDVRLGANAMRRCRHVFHMIDIDDRRLINEVVDVVQDILGYVPARIETPHGMHLLIKVSSFDRETARRWFSVVPKKIEETKPLVEYKKAFQEPVPGILYKGDFVPRFRPEER